MDFRLKVEGYRLAKKLTIFEARIERGDGGVGSIARQQEAASLIEREINGAVIHQTAVEGRTQFPCGGLRHPGLHRDDGRHTGLDQTRCKGCGLCVTVCPKDVLGLTEEVTATGYFAAFQVRPEDCITCAMCCTMCPDVAITITEVETPGD